MWQSIKNLYHLLQAFFANRWYGFPGKKLKIIGVSGTDGKTTTTHLIYHVLKSAGKKVSMISSVYANVGGRTYDTGFHVTTPDVFPLYGFLKASSDHGDEYFVLETTSHSLSQNRVWGIPFEAAVITNITHEHLDFHKTFAEYVKAKSILLQRAKFRIVNADDESYQTIKKIIPGKMYTYGFEGPRDFSQKLAPYAPLFNQYNYLAAYGTCRLLGVSDDLIRTSIVSFTLPPGRLEVLVKKPVTVIIDFAHTPNAFGQVLPAIRNTYLGNPPVDGPRLIHVFGSAAKRDESKRPIMGEVSAKFADVIILTEEDYRTENPLKIASEIAEGIEKRGFRKTDPERLGKETRKTYTTVIDRGKAIEKATAIANKGDVIVLTGKAHEKSLCRGKKEYPWDEKQAVMEAMRKYPISNS